MIEYGLELLNFQRILMPKVILAIFCHKNAGALEPFLSFMLLKFQSNAIYDIKSVSPEQRACKVKNDRNASF